MRFLHTADWQIGMKAASAGAAGRRVREARLESAARVAAIPADFLLVAGDTFEDNGVDRALVERVASILASFAGPVFVLPGNHDPLLPGSVWEHPSWRQHANVTVIREAGAYAVPGGTLLAAPLMERHSRLDPTAWLEGVARPEGIVIGMSHGTVEGVDDDTEHHPIARTAWRRAELDYLALGHWHSTSLYSDEAGRTRMAYSGTHETTKFGERDSGNVLRVTVAGEVKVERLATGVLRWETVEEDMRGSAELETVRARLQALPETALVRCRLRGLLHAEDRALVEQLRDIGQRFPWFGLDTEALRPAAKEGWIGELPAGAVREAAEKLFRDADSGDPVATEALLELMAIAAKVEA